MVPNQRYTVSGGELLQPLIHLFLLVIEPAKLWAGKYVLTLRLQ